MLSFWMNTTETLFIVDSESVCLLRDGGGRKKCNSVRGGDGSVVLGWEKVERGEIGNRRCLSVLCRRPSHVETHEDEEEVIDEADEVEISTLKRLLQYVGPYANSDVSDYTHLERCEAELSGSNKIDIDSVCFCVSMEKTAALRPILAILSLLLSFSHITWSVPWFLIKHGGLGVATKLVVCQDDRRRPIGEAGVKRTNTPPRVRLGERSINDFKIIPIICRPFFIAVVVDNDIDAEIVADELKEQLARKGLACRRKGIRLEPVVGSGFLEETSRSLIRVHSILEKLSLKLGSNGLFVFEQHGTKAMMTRGSIGTVKKLVAEANACCKVAVLSIGVEWAGDQSADALPLHLATRVDAFAARLAPLFSECNKFFDGGVCNLFNMVLTGDGSSALHKVRDEGASTCSTKSEEGRDVSDEGVDEGHQKISLIRSSSTASTCSTKSDDWVREEEEDQFGLMRCFLSQAYTLKLYGSGARICGSHSVKVLRTQDDIARSLGNPSCSAPSSDKALELAIEQGKHIIELARAESFAIVSGQRGPRLEAEVVGDNILMVMDEMSNVAMIPTCALQAIGAVEPVRKDAITKVYQEQLHWLQNALHLMGFCLRMGRDERVQRLLWVADTLRAILYWVGKRIRGYGCSWKRHGAYRVTTSAQHPTISLPRGWGGVDTSLCWTMVDSVRSHHHISKMLGLRAPSRGIFLQNFSHSYASLRDRGQLLIDLVPLLVPKVAHSAPVLGYILLILNLLVLGDSRSTMVVASEIGINGVIGSKSASFRDWSWVWGGFEANLCSWSSLEAATLCSWLRKLCDFLFRTSGVAEAMVANVPLGCVVASSSKRSVASYLAQSMSSYAPKYQEYVATCEEHFILTGGRSRSNSMMTEGILLLASIAPLISQLQEQGKLSSIFELVLCKGWKVPLELPSHCPSHKRVSSARRKARRHPRCIVVSDGPEASLKLVPSSGLSAMRGVEEKLAAALTLLFLRNEGKEKAQLKERFAKAGWKRDRYQGWTKLGPSRRGSGRMQVFVFGGKEVGSGLNYSSMESMKLDLDAAGDDAHNYDWDLQREVCGLDDSEFNPVCDDDVVELFGNNEKADPVALRQAVEAIEDKMENEVDVREEEFDRVQEDTDLDPMPEEDPPVGDDEAPLLGMDDGGFGELEGGFGFSHDREGDEEEEEDAHVGEMEGAQVEVGTRGAAGTRLTPLSRTGRIAQLAVEAEHEKRIIVLSNVHATEVQKIVTLLPMNTTIGIHRGSTRMRRTEVDGMLRSRRYSGLRRQIRVVRHVTHSMESVDFAELPSSRSHASRMSSEMESIGKMSVGSIESISSSQLRLKYGESNPGACCWITSQILCLAHSTQSTASILGILQPLGGDLAITVVRLVESVRCHLAKDVYGVESRGGAIDDADWLEVAVREGVIDPDEADPKNIPGNDLLLLLRMSGTAPMVRVSRCTICREIMVQEEHSAASCGARIASSFQVACEQCLPDAVKEEKKLSRREREKRKRLRMRHPAYVSKSGQSLVLKPLPRTDHGTIVQFPEALFPLASVATLSAPITASQLFVELSSSGVLTIHLLPLEVESLIIYHPPCAHGALSHFCPVFRIPERDHGWFLMEDTASFHAPSKLELLHDALPRLLDGDWRIVAVVGRWIRTEARVIRVGVERCLSCPEVEVLLNQNSFLFDHMKTNFEDAEKALKKECGGGGEGEEEAHAGSEEEADVGAGAEEIDDDGNEEEQSWKSFLRQISSAREDPCPFEEAKWNALEEVLWEGVGRVGELSLELRDAEAEKLLRMEGGKLMNAQRVLSYGEVEVGGIAKVFEYLQPGVDDILYDAGSGIGNIVIFSILFSKMAGAVGVELHQERALVAQRARKRLQEKVGILGRLATRICFINGDFLQHPEVMAVATILFVNNFLFEYGGAMEMNLLQQAIDSNSVHTIVLVADRSSLLSHKRTRTRKRSGLHDQKGFVLAKKVATSVSWQHGSLYLYIYKRKTGRSSMRTTLSPSPLRKHEEVEKDLRKRAVMHRTRRKSRGAVQASRARVAHEEVQRISIRETKQMQRLSDPVQRISLRIRSAKARQEAIQRAGGGEG